MKRLIEFFAEQKLFGDLITIVIIGLGFYSFMTIRREAFPNILDIISVATVFPGAAAEEVEQLVTNPLEQDLKDVDGIKKMMSTTIEGRSLILLQLDVDATDTEKAKSDIRDVVDSFTPELPEGAERPIIQSIEAKQTPIIEVSVAGDMPPLELRAQAKRLEREFETVSGVAAVKPLGMEDREVQVELDPAKLARFSLTIDDVVQGLKKRNVSVPGGTIEGDEHNKFLEKAVRTSGQFTGVQGVEETIVRSNEIGRTLRVKDVARITEGLAKSSVISHSDGVKSIRLTILKRERADAIDLVDAVQKKLDELKPSLDPRLKVTLINDVSEYIRRRLGVLLGNFTIGLGLVLVFLPLFLPYRFALLVAIGEPFAFLGTILVFQAFDVALNMISIVGLILVSGILVDDGIVVVENVARHIKEGLSPKKAALLGAQEVWVPVIASSMTTILAFLPMAAMTGIFGKFIRYIPLGVIIPILISLFENFFIMPHHVGAFLRASDFDTTKRRGFLGRLQQGSNGIWETRLLPAYLGILSKILRWRYAVIAGAAGLVVASILLAVTVMKVVLFPPEAIEIFLVRMEAPLGTSIEGTSRLVKMVESSVNQIPPDEMKNYLTNVGIHQQDPNDPNTRRGTELAQIVVYLTPETDRSRSAQQIIDDLRTKVGKPDGIDQLTFERVNPGPPVGKPVSIHIRGDEYPELRPPAEEVKRILSGVKGVSDIKDTYYAGKRQLNVKVNYDEASAAGLSVGSVGNTVRAAYEGLVATSIRTLDEEVKVRVYLSKDQRTRASTLSDLKVPNPGGALVPLSAVATFDESETLASRQHEANRREIRVLAEVDTAIVSAGQANKVVANQLSELRQKFPNVSFHFGGEDEDTQESMKSLARAFVLAIIGIFVVLVITFRTLLQPLVVLITIPLGLISVILTFFVHGMPLSFLGMVGMVGLSGIIVNNAIVFVEFVNIARANGLDRWESITEAARRRAMPIFLTTVTTCLGILPTAYGIGGIDKFVVPIALAMGWGILVGSVLTLFLLPAALSALDDFSALWERVKGRLRAKRAISLPQDR